MERDNGHNVSSLGQQERLSSLQHPQPIRQLLQERWDSIWNGSTRALVPHHIVQQLDTVWNEALNWIDATPCFASSYIGPSFVPSNVPPIRLTRCPLTSNTRSSTVSLKRPLKKAYVSHEEISIQRNGRMDSEPVRLTNWDKRRAQMVRTGRPMTQRESVLEDSHTTRQEDGPSANANTSISFSLYENDTDVVNAEAEFAEMERNLPQTQSEILPYLMQFKYSILKTYASRLCLMNYSRHSRKNELAMYIANNIRI